MCRGLLRSTRRRLVPYRQGRPTPNTPRGVPVHESRREAMAAAIPYGVAGFRHEIPVRNTEFDEQGVVFNTHYLTYCDHAMDDFLRRAVGDESNFELMVKSASLTWYAPLRYRGRSLPRSARVSPARTSQQEHPHSRVQRLLAGPWSRTVSTLRKASRSSSNQLCS